MKNIIVCCDGTWNSPDFREGTNVWKLYLAMPENNEKQVKYYDTGVGTQGLVDKLTGGLTGKGLVDNIFEAYRFICLHYQPGDNICIFGFSRGAYTARALSGVLADIGVLQFGLSCGNADYITDFTTCFDDQMLSESNDQFDFSILCDCCKKTSAHVDEVKRLFKTYKKDTYKKVKKHISEHGEIPGVDHTILLETILSLHPDWKSDKPNIEMLGVWDTVSALGIPSLANVVMASGNWKKKILDAVSNFIFKSSRNEYAFINNQLNPLVRNGYHALALDERRDMFRPVLWDDDPLPHQNIEQVWFVGAHANVGGGYLDHSLSDIPLQWMIDKAKQHNILFDTYHTVHIRPNYLGLLNRSYKDGMFKYLPHSRRMLPVNKNIHGSVHSRVKYSMHYIPKNLYKHD